MSGSEPGYPETDYTESSRGLIQPWGFAPGDQIGGVHDGERILPAKDEHTDVPLSYWREHLKRKRQQEQHRPAREKETPAKPAGSEEDKPPGSIDEYA
ncbi:MAG: hypothetical protein Q8O79_05355 [Pseudomonadota bacterium]|nr:hypothetical protein [Pseudomonadota bacterium]